MNGVQHNGRTMHLLLSVVHLSAQLSIYATDIAGSLVALCDIQ